MAYCAALMASAALVVAHTFCGSSNPCVQAEVVMQIGLALLMQLQQGQVQTRSPRPAALCWTDLLDATMSLTAACVCLCCSQNGLCDCTSQAAHPLGLHRLPMGVQQLGDRPTWL